MNQHQKRYERSTCANFRFLFHLLPMCKIKQLLSTFDRYLAKHEDDPYGCGTFVRILTLSLFVSRCLKPLTLERTDGGRQPNIVENFLTNERAHFKSRPELNLFINKNQRRSSKKGTPTF